MVRSPSADINILTFFVSHNFGDITIYIDNGTGKNRKIINVTSSELSAREKIALIGLHAFSGNDYVSAFFRKGKCAFWKAMLKQSQFLEAFCHLGKELEVTNDLFKVLEKFICFLYGFPKHEEVNVLRRSIFWDKFKKKKQVVDLSLLPPCRDNLQFHVMRANYVGYIFRNADHTCPMPLQDVQWTFECPLDISVRPLDEWTFECPLDISVCPMNEWTFECRMDFSVRPLVEWTYECPMDISVRPMVEWTFVYVQWTLLIFNTKYDNAGNAFCLLKAIKN